MTLISISKTSAGGYAVQFRYNPTLVELIKTAVPSPFRSWNAERRCWTILDTHYARQFASLAEGMGHRVAGHFAREQAGQWAGAGAGECPPWERAKAGGRTNGSQPRTLNWAEMLFAHMGRDRSPAVYRALSKVLHPDTATGDHNLQQQLNDAYNKLPR